MEREWPEVNSERDSRNRDGFEILGFLDYTNVWY